MTGYYPPGHRETLRDRRFLPSPSIGSLDSCGSACPNYQHHRASGLDTCTATGGLMPAIRVSAFPRFCPLEKAE